MIIKIRKRDGRNVRFNPEKINNAILRAFIAVGNNNPNSDEVTNLVLQNLDTTFKNKIPTVEDIQDEVEKALIKLNFPEVAKAYILYRDERTKIRESNTRLMRTFYNIQSNESFGKNLTPFETITKYGLEGVMEFNKIFILNPRHSKYLEDGLIHIHNLEYLNSGIETSFIDLTKVIIANKYKFNNIEEYTTLILNLCMNLKNEQSLGPTFYKIDEDLVQALNTTFSNIFISDLFKFIKTLKIDTIKPIDINNLSNYISFSNDKVINHLIINYNLKSYKDIIEVIYHNSKEEVYKTFYETIKTLFINLNNLIKDNEYKINFSVGNHNMIETKVISEIFINVLKNEFKDINNIPIHLTYKILDDLNVIKEEQSYQMLLNSFNLINKNIISYVFESATYNQNLLVAYQNDLRITNHNLVEKNITTNSIITLSTTTINLVRVALMSKEYNKFLKLLDEVLSIVFEQLKERLLIIKTKPNSMFPTLINNNVWFNHHNNELKEIIINASNLNIGIVGLKEVVTYFNHQKGYDIINYINEKINKQNEMDKLNYILKETQNTKIVKKFIDQDKNKYGLIDNITNKALYDTIYEFKSNDIDSLNLALNDVGLTQTLLSGGHQFNIKLNDEAIKNDNIFKILKLASDNNLGNITITK